MNKLVFALDIKTLPVSDPDPVTRELNYRPGLCRQELFSQTRDLKITFRHADTAERTSESLL
jgi:hypothetical protein